MQKTLNFDLTAFSIEKNNQILTYYSSNIIFSSFKLMCNIGAEYEEKMQVQRRNHNGNYYLNFVYTKKNGFPNVK